MQVITNKQIAALLTPQDAIGVMRQAFASYGKAGSMQRRVRIDADSTKLSMMGAIIPGIHAAGAKVYTTINGKFSFVVLLFSTLDGSLLAVMEGDAMTEYRTAAVTALAADTLARRDAQTLAVFGTGVQAWAHVPALLAVRAFTSVLVSGIDGADAFAARVTQEYGIACRAVSAEQAAAEGDVLVTATRSPAPLFDGNSVKPGAFVAAIGSSKPDTREVDDHLVRRAARIVVEWSAQAREEAGDLLGCADGCFAWSDVLELSTVLNEPAAWKRADSDIILYKAVGVGLEDVALAEYIHRRLSVL